MTVEDLREQGKLKMKHQNKMVKKVAVSRQRQITLPKTFCDELGVGDEIFVELSGNRLVLRPAKNDDFSSQILNELVEEGFEGEALIQEFENRKAQIGSAFSRYIEEERPKAREIPDDELFGDMVDE